MERKPICLFLFFLFAGHVFAQQNYPSPSSKENLLFYIQHDRGHNTYVYKAHLDKSQNFVKKSPVRVYRELFEEGGKIKPLTKIQDMFAYGIKSTTVSPNVYQISVVSLPEQKITVKLNKDNKAIAETVVNNEQILLERIFLKLTEGTSGMNTKLDYILFYGKSPSGKPLVEKIVP